MLTTKNGKAGNKESPAADGFPGFCRRVPFFLFLALAFILAGCKPPGPRALWQGKDLLEHGQYTEAIDKLKTATSLLSTNALAWNYLGLAYHQAGQLNDAAEAYRKALALDQNIVEVHYNLGCLYLEQNRPDLAKSDFTAYTLHRGDKSPEGWIKLGEAQMRLHDLAGAEKSLNQARQSDPQNPEALNDLGVIQVQRNRAQEAAQFFNAALHTKPDYAPATLNAAIVSEQYLNSKPAALKHYQDYLALQPRPANWDAVDAAVRSLQGESRPTPVTPPTRPAPSNTVVQTSSPVSLPPRQIANTPPRNSAPRPEPPAATNPRTPPPTTSNPTEVVQLQPEPTVHAAQDSGSVTTFSTEPPASVTEPPKAADKRGFLSHVNPANLFRGSSKSNQPQEPTQVAAATPESATPVTFPRYSYHHPRKPADGDRGAAEKAFASGSQAQQAGQLSQAILDYRRATEADPGYFDPYYNLGVVCVRAGDLADALKAYETALAIQPNSHDARFNFALALKQNNYPIDAAIELEKLIAKFPNDAYAHYALGSLYAQQLRQPAKARLHYEKVLELDPSLPQAAAVHDWLWSHPH
jgi:Flp pilus assembly protein TadD